MSWGPAGATLDVEAALAEVGVRVRAAVEERLEALVASDDLRVRMLEYPRRGGKALRPALLLAACAAFEGDDRRAMPAAVAIELMHNAFLVHDDVEDDATDRRDGPASIGWSARPSPCRPVTPSRSPPSARCSIAAR